MKLKNIYLTFIFIFCFVLFSKAQSDETISKFLEVIRGQLLKDPCGCEKLQYKEIALIPSSHTIKITYKDGNIITIPILNLNISSKSHKVSSYDDCDSKCYIITYYANYEKAGSYKNGEKRDFARFIVSDDPYTLEKIIDNYITLIGK